MKPKKQLQIRGAQVRGILPSSGSGISVRGITQTRPG